MPHSLEARMEELAVDPLLEALDCAALIVGPDGHIRHANALASAWSGIPRGELLQMTHAAWSELLDRHFTVEPDSQHEEGPGQYQRLRTRHFPQRLLQRRVRVVEHEDGREGLIETLRDLTAELRHEKELRQLADRHAREIAELERRATQAETFKMDLTANVTHDLRTPLASIKASVSGLLAGDVAYDPQALRETLTVIEEETDRLQRRVQNLLSMARMEAGDVALNSDWVDLADVASSAVEGLKSLQGDRKIQLEYESDLPMVLGDFIQLQIAIRNLVENAILYAPAESRIEIGITANLGQIHVRVRDYGSGLMPDEFEKVFDKFYRGRSARKIPGTGLGLPICRGIAEAHGGRLWAEHAPGGGVAFVLSIPVPEEQPDLEEGRDV
jgi:K+-sensing histidine kinase KdpD